jgi:hypothetical protein
LAAIEDWQATQSNIGQTITEGRTEANRIAMKYGRNAHPINSAFRWLERLNRLAAKPGPASDLITAPAGSPRRVNSLTLPATR